MELARTVGELQDALDAGEMESGVELADVLVQHNTLRRGVGESETSSLLVPLEVGEGSSSVRLLPLGLGEVLESTLDLLRRVIDGALVASGPPSRQVLIESGLAPLELMRNGASRFNSTVKGSASSVSIIAAIGWE